MPFISLLAAALLATLVVATLAIAAPNNNPLERYRGQSRVLVMLANGLHDPRLAQQRRLFEAMRQGAHERDLVLVQGIGDTPEATALRRTLGIASGFRAILIGKDGTVKLNSTTPLGPDELFPLIDTMPMRRDEMRRRAVRADQ